MTHVQGNGNSKGGWCVVSYSHTGNNSVLAKRVARHFNADHLTIAEAKRRKIMTIVLDIIFNRTPKTTNNEEHLGQYDLVVFIGPVWMGKAATPFRRCFKNVGSQVKRYAYISVCGGADGPNHDLESDLSRQLGSGPVAVIELHIADLLPRDPAPQRKDTMEYRISDYEAEKMADTVVEILARNTAQRSSI